MAAERAKRIGGRIRERREELDLKQHELATRIGVASVTKDYVSRWELGKVDVSLGPYLDTIAKALDTTEADLMAGPVAEREPPGKTPDVLGTLNGDMDPRQLDRIETKLDELLRRTSSPSPTEPDTAPPAEGPRSPHPPDEPIPPKPSRDPEDTGEAQTG